MLYRESRELAQAVRRQGAGLVQFYGQRIVMGLVRQTSPLVVELTMNDITLDDEHLMLGAWVRFYDQEFGLARGDTVLLSRLANGDWFVFDVVTKHDIVLPSGNSIYVDDRILDADTDAVVFDSFPPNLKMLELTWNAWLASGASTPATMFVAFNGDYPVTESDYFWRVAGSIAKSTGDSGDNSWGGIAPIRDYESPTTGRVRFIDYNRDATPNDGYAYLGEGSFQIDPGGGGTPDVWVVAGAREEASGPLTDITVHVNGENFEAGSRFTLTGY